MLNIRGDLIVQIVKDVHEVKMYAKILHSMYRQTYINVNLSTA